MRILVISKYFTDNLSTKVHGLNKLLRISFDAIKNIGQIDTLLYERHEKLFIFQITMMILFLK